MESVISIEHLKILSNVKIGFAEFTIIPTYFKTTRLVRYYTETKTFAVYDEQTDIWEENLSEMDLHKFTVLPDAIYSKALICTGNIVIDESRD
jgi:hypothetical protein